VCLGLPQLAEGNRQEQQERQKDAERESTQPESGAGISSKHPLVLLSGRMGRLFKYHQVIPWGAWKRSGQYQPKVSQPRVEWQNRDGTYTIVSTTNATAAGIPIKWPSGQPG
jgi:hypothetical protein